MSLLRLRGTHSILGLFRRTFAATAQPTKEGLRALPLLSTSPAALSRALMKSGDMTFKKSTRTWDAIRQGSDPHQGDDTLAPFVASLAGVGTVLEQTGSEKLTQKLLLEVPGGLKIECVVIPQDKSSSVCVSSQVFVLFTLCSLLSALCSHLSPLTSRLSSLTYRLPHLTSHLSHLQLWGAL
jgi:hypothetical protein